MTTLERRIHIVWPQSGFIPESTLRNWFHDAIANGDIAADEIDGSDSLEHVCRSLHYAGTITLHREWRADL